MRLHDPSNLIRVMPAKGIGTAGRLPLPYRRQLPRAWPKEPATSSDLAVHVPATTGRASRPVCSDGTLAGSAATLLARIRDRGPRVHVLTSPVAQPFSANLLLAVGAVPSMTTRADAMADFIASSDTLVVNLGMLDEAREAAILRAVPLAREAGRPWTLDPVKVERAGARRLFANELLEQRPSVLRANTREAEALAGGPDLAALARRHCVTVAATGAIDRLVEGGGAPPRSLELAHGSPLMDRVTAMGCGLSALMGAFLAVEPDPFAAAAAALLAFGIAGEIAAERARGPGSFAVHILDTLHGLDEAVLVARAGPE